MEKFMELDLRTIMAEYSISGREIETTCKIPRYKIERYKKQGKILNEDYNKLVVNFPLVFSVIMP